MLLNISYFLSWTSGKAFLAPIIPSVHPEHSVQVINTKHTVLIKFQNRFKSLSEIKTGLQQSQLDTSNPPACSCNLRKKHNKKIWHLNSCKAGSLINLIKTAVGSYYLRISPKILFFAKQVLGVLLPITSFGGTGGGDL